MTTTRTAMVLCPDWPVFAGGYRSSDVVAVMKANRVVACSQQARQFGVSVGSRRRSAQGVCPDIEIIDDAPTRDARAFEPVVAILEEFCPQVGIVEPGKCVFATRGPSRYFGGDKALVSNICSAMNTVLGPMGSHCCVGIADGLFAANLAAQKMLIVAPDTTPKFLRPLPINLLNVADLASLLVRLGIKTLGAFADLDHQSVVARFGPEGARAHYLARGLDASIVVPQPKDNDLSVESHLDPPAERVDIATFATRSLASELLTKLHDQTLSATIVAIEAHTDHGESHIRHWRFDDGLSKSMLVDRLRWQLDGWLSGSSENKPTAGIVLVRLSAVEVVSGNGHQVSLWDEKSDVDIRAAKGFARIQGQLGLDSVMVASIVEGRDPRERVQLVSWGQNAPAPKKRTLAHHAPWPMSIPSPSPTVVFEQPIAIRVVDVNGNSISVSRRGELSSTPATLVTQTKRYDITMCAGPWTHDDQWWDRVHRRRRAFLQLLDSSGTGHLVFRENNQWWLDGTYD